MEKYAEHDKNNDLNYYLSRNVLPGCENLLMVQNAFSCLDGPLDPP